MDYLGGYCKKTPPFREGTVVRIVTKALSIYSFKIATGFCETLAMTGGGITAGFCETLAMTGGGIATGFAGKLCNYTE